MVNQLLATSVVLLAISAPAAAQSVSKAAYDELCVSCHKQPQRLAARIARTDEARAKLDAFLTKHYAPDAAKRAAVIDFLFTGK